MELQITGKNVESSPAMRKYIERKLGKLDRHLPHITKSKIEITEEKTKSPQQHFVVQVTVDRNGNLLRSQERGETLFAAIDKAISAAAETKPTSKKVVKVKRFAVKPMSVDEAIDQMELLGHDFFLFFKADSEELSLLYRRKDGNYGLIEPELG